MSIKQSLIAHIGCSATMGFGKPTALDVNPHDLSELEGEMMADINASPGDAVVGYSPAPPADGRVMTFLGVALHRSSDTPRGEFRVR